MPATDALNEKQFVMMKPSELLPYARDRSDTMAQPKVDALADSISRRGYRASMHDGKSSEIQLDHHSHQYPRTQLAEGNHRVAAMTKIGYDKPVRVRVRHVDDRAPIRLPGRT
jgi:hypothetical protein